MLNRKVASDDTAYRALRDLRTEETQKVEPRQENGQCSELVGCRSDIVRSIVLIKAKHETSAADKQRHFHVVHPLQQIAWPLNLRTALTNSLMVLQFS